MNFIRVIEEFTKNKNAFKELLYGLSKDFYLWKESQDKWCLLEIVCHLYDEEREDFRARIKHVLENPDLPFKPIDPINWVKIRKYVEQDYNIVLQNFLFERDTSIKWLKSLSDPKWDNVNKHPKGNMSAKMLLVNWLAHDYLHLKQIIKLKYDYLKVETNENLLYAGDW